MPEIKIYKMFAQVTVTADGSANYDVQEDGEICSVLLDMACTGADVLNDGGNCELSFSSVNGFSTNDTRASILGVRSYLSAITTGGGPVSKNAFITFAPFGIPVAAGERIYLHTAVSGTTTIAFSAWVYHCINLGTARGRVGRRVR